MIVPLRTLRPGDVGHVVEVLGTDDVVQVLAERGLQKGCRLRLLAGGLTALCQVGDCRLCLRADDRVEIFVRLDG